MNNLWKWIVFGLVAGAIGGYISSCSAEPYTFANSPMNWNNSVMNFENNSANFKNSPMNFANSPMNSQATNGVFDQNGNRIGYTTVNPQGTINIFDNEGNRLGYSNTGNAYAPVRIGK